MSTRRSYFQRRYKKQQLKAKRAELVDRYLEENYPQILKEANLYADGELSGKEPVQKEEGYVKLIDEGVVDKIKEDLSPSTSNDSSLQQQLDPTTISKFFNTPFPEDQALPSDLQDLSFSSDFDLFVNLDSLFANNTCLF